MKFFSRFHRGRHRIGERVFDIAARINRDYFGEYDPDGPAWQMSSDERYLMFTGNIAIPKPFEEEQRQGLLTFYPDPLPCPHTDRKITYEWEDFYSNGDCGIPASNMPIASDVVGQRITCVECGQELSLDSATGVIVCDGKQGWHTDDDD